MTIRRYTSIGEATGAAMRRNAERAAALATVKATTDTTSATSDYEKIGVTVTQSTLTGHWVVNHGMRDAEGFRRREDAEAAAQALFEKHRHLYGR